MSLLTILTLVINYIGLAITVWLGWYILTRSFNQPISLLTSLTLWSISGIFINSLLAINPPSLPANVPSWTVFLFPFWDSDVLAHGGTEWLAGWLVIPAIGFWHHVTMLIRSNRWKIWQYIQVIAVYLSISLGIIAMIKTPYMYSEVSGNPLLLDSLKPGILYSTFLLLLTIIMIMSILNIRSGIENTKSSLAKQQLKILSWATLTAGLTAPISFIAVNIEIRIPRAIISLLLGATVLLIGYSVGKYSALIEGRLIRRDFIYSAVAMSIVALLYSLIIWISVLIFNVPPAAYIFILIFAFATHSLVDTARHYLDRVFFSKEDRNLRQNIRQMSSRVRQQGIEETLELQLDLACTSIRASSGMIMLFEDDEKKITVCYQCSKDISNIPPEVFISEDYIHITPGGLHPQFEEIILLVPIYLHEQQIGAILLGPPVNSPQYPESDIDRMLEVSDQIAITVNQFRLGNQLLAQAASTIRAANVKTKSENGVFTPQNIESALRNLHDYAYLGDSALANTKLVQARYNGQNATHLDRGKILYSILEEAICMLRPDTDFSSNTPPREWYSYLILYQAYFEDKLNRDIMSYLYISEGTFNRTRRSAIRAIARALSELEHNLS